MSTVPPTDVNDVGENVSEHPLGGDMLRAHQPAINIPNGGIGNNAFRLNLSPALQAHTIGFAIFDEDLIH